MEAAKFKITVTQETHDSMGVKIKSTNYSEKDQAFAIVAMFNELERPEAKTMILGTLLKNLSVQEKAEAIAHSYF